ncbi:hypothetical protein [Halobacillus sp. BBL2006]|uniref:hypothetical protein n=1 Tax=Halobacillus sp. BBL2006 TaxID=1543706 RepID=UPI000542BB24|nr:hypothetical protein [Halobacillus sp. BBL2006]KHE68021.1 hypothetical protein LD39_15430 [Halobacillus sp. BBL2006]
MLKTLASLGELTAAKEDFEELKRTHPDVFDQLLHVVSLTRQLQIKYGYMGSLLMDEDLKPYHPEYVKESILSLYQKEVGKLTAHEDVQIVQDRLNKHKKVGYPKLFLLILGAKPEMLKGSTIIK